MRVCVCVVCCGHFGVLNSGSVSSQEETKKKVGLWVGNDVVINTYISLPPPRRPEGLLNLPFGDAKRKP